MFRILVADDERVTRKGIITMLERGLKEEVEYIEAANGIEALEIVEKQMIHLIITDICMPLCSGLEFVEKLRRQDENMMVIIISGYENFEYARQAVKLDVKDYIMKPLRQEELLGLVEKCIADIQKERMELQEKSRESRRREQLLKKVQKESILNIINGVQIRSNIEKLNSMDIRIRDELFFAVFLEYECEQEQHDIIDFAVKNIAEECLDKRFAEKYCDATRKRGQLAILFWISETGERDDIEKQVSELIRLIEKYVRIRILAGIGNTVYTMDEIPVSCEQAEIAADCKIFGENRKLIRYLEIPEREGKTVPECRDIEIAAKEEEYLKYISRIYGEGISIETLEKLKEGYSRICKYVKECTDSQEIPEGKEFSEFWSEFELRSEIRNIYQYMKDLPKDGAKNKQLVEDISVFVTKHVTEDIDLGYIADRFGKTPGYIGTIFRKERKQGFNDFITEERMKIAKKLLRDHTLTVQQVGEMCGYHNSKYFSIVFKKSEGISPKAYQMAQRKEEGH